MIRRVINVAECQGYARLKITRFHFLDVYEPVVRYTGRVNEQRAKLDERYKTVYEMVVSAHVSQDGVHPGRSRGRSM